MHTTRPIIIAFFNACAADLEGCIVILVVMGKFAYVASGSWLAQSRLLTLGAEAHKVL
jgi:hypothetical protein